MAQEPWRAYLELALGVTDASRKKAKKAVKQLVGKGGATAEQLQVMAEDLVRIGVNNREALARMVRAELDRAVARVGLVSEDEVAELRARIRDLEEQLRRSGTAPAAEEVATPESSVARTDAAGSPQRSLRQSPQRRP